MDKWNSHIAEMYKMIQHQYTIIWQYLLELQGHINLNHTGIHSYMYMREIISI